MPRTPEEKAAYQKAWYEANKKPTAKRTLKTKEEKAKTSADYYQANKERIAKRVKEHNQKPETKEKRAAYNAGRAEERSIYEKEYRLNNKDKIQTYREDNKEKIAAHDKVYGKKYREEHKEQIYEANKIYNQTPIAVRAHAVARWASRGLTPPIGMTLFDLYDNIYLPCTHCMVCKNEFRNSYDKNCDHNHDLVENNFRNVLCRDCNTMDRWRNKI